jgi:ABC-2 type transport system ATP-binding protein
MLQGTRRRILTMCVALTGMGLMGAVGPTTPAASASFTKTTMTFPVTVGPNDDVHCDVLGDLYVPDDASATNPVPAILTTNGFGGSKDDQAGLAAFGASHGYEVLSYSGLGFGGSGCQIELDDPDWDGKAASQLISFLGARPEVKKDAPGDPRVGMIGGSYGGGVQFATASIDARLDTIVPIITWNDLAYSLTPNNDAPSLVWTNSPPGVPKWQWTSLFFGLGLSQPLTNMSNPATEPATTCPGFDSRVCTSYLESLALGYPPPETVAMLRHASAASFMSRIRIPTMLLQGEADTLFNINEAVANYQGIKANGVPVKLVLQSWGHSDSTPAPGEFSEDDPLSTHEGRLVVNWFDHYLKDLPVSTGPEVEYFRDWVTYDPSGTAAPAYANAPSWPVGTTAKLLLSGTGELVGSRSRVRAGSATFVNPPGGEPASYSETSAVQNMDPFASIPPSDPPGESVAFTTPPLDAGVTSVGIPQAKLRLSATVPPTLDPSTYVVVFVKLYDIAPDGTVTLVHRLVSPVRVADLSKPVKVTLPGVVHRYRKGHRISLVVAATDQAYTGSRIANVLSVTTDAASLSSLTLPVVGDRAIVP